MAPGEKAATAVDGYAPLQTPRASPGEEIDTWRQDMRNPLERANFLSRVTLSWVNAAMSRGYKKVLEEDDVWDLPTTDTSATLQGKFDECYAVDRERQQEKDSTQPTPIYRAMWASTKGVMSSAIFLHALSGTAMLLQPLLIKAVLQVLNGDPNSFGITNGYVLAALLTATAFIGVTALEYATYLTIRAGVNARMIVVNGVYQKILKLTSHARMSMNSGDIITFASVDSERLYEAYAYGPWAFVAPAMITAVCILIGVEMGALVALAAAACSVSVLVFALTNARRIGRLRRQVLEVAGERVKVTNEVLQGIRVIKLYAWETSIAQRIADIRAREIRLIRKYDYIRVANIVVLTLAQNLMMAACYIVYVYQGNELTVPIAFALLGFTNALRMPFGNFSSGVVFTSEAIASMKRIAKFMSADELRLISGTTSSPPLREGEPIIEITDADFSWVARASDSAELTGSVARPILRNLNLRITPGSLTIVVGAVGSGKSSLVSALLGEMERLRGTCVVRGAVAYASQEAWIQHNTVRENIVFGAPFDSEYYAKVVSSCQLTRDLEILDDGDATEIGERGINLSGGQKARVSLARAMYRRDADLVVLDDPLSALDVHVANAVFFQSVKGLAASKTRLLVLNAHYHLLKHADRIIVLSDGEIIGDGTYDQVRTTFTFLEDQAQAKVLTAPSTSSGFENVEDTVDDDEDGPNYTHMHDSVNYAESSEMMDRMSVSSAVSRLSRRSSRVTRTDGRTNRDDDAVATKKKAFMLEEDRAVGSITWRTYASFFAACGFNGTATVLVVLVLFALAQGGILGSDYFITYWSNGSLGQYNQETLLWMYVGIIGVATVLGIFRGIAFTEICIRASQALHARYFTKVLMAPINTFFDITPIGRVLNRFSRDLDQIDNPIPHYALSVLSYGMLVISIFVVCAVTTPTTLILYAPLTYMCFYVQKYFLASSRELKRLDGITRSPFLNLVGETINGIESIRSFRMTDHFSQKCRDLLDYNSKFFFMFQSAGKWLGMRLDWLMTSIVAVVSFTCIASRESIGSASAGIALTYAVQLTVQFQRLITLATMTENMMTSYERIAHYGTLDEEGDTKQLDLANPPPLSWPTNGTIEFSNVYLRYREGLDFVLRGVSFSARDGEKIGVCGRTGSGKSTLMNALFRTVEAAQGVVRIDGIDIATIKLQHLRSKLTIIPQDPVLFSGSLRENLDPFNEKSDDELFSALRKVHLIDDVGRWGQGLSYEVSEKGENLSVGQRQLICIARALLRESRIVVLDEATASVDQELDRLIQVAVKECFGGRTALTIAHRLETIADSDRILVMEQGRVAEFDTPSNLLAKPEGLFASLMQSTQH